jgi:hypothetical protein
LDNVFLLTFVNSGFVGSHGPLWKSLTQTLACKALGGLESEVQRPNSENFRKFQKMCYFNSLWGARSVYARLANEFIRS